MDTNLKQKKILMKSSQNQKMKDAYTAFEKNLSTSMFVCILLVLVGEIIYFFALEKQIFLRKEMLAYILRYIVSPFIVNMICWCIWRLVLVKSKADFARALTALLSMLFIGANILITHNVLTGLYAVLVVVPFIALVYENRRITRITFGATVLVYAISMVIIYFWSENLPNRFVLNAVAGASAISIAAVIVFHVERFTIRRKHLVEEGYQENLQLQKDARYDKLTGVMNYAGFLAMIECFLSIDVKDNVGDDYIKVVENTPIQTNELPGDVYLSILDLDHFKLVNDEFGHDVGNIVLERMGKILQQYTGNNMQTARFGGEEFIIVFYRTDYDVAMRTLKEIHDTFGNYYFPEVKKKLSFSAGLAKLENGMTLKELFNKADQALYHSKNNGRNQITVA